MATPRTATAFAASLGLAIAIAVGYGLHHSAKKRDEQRALVSLVEETTGQLRQGLKTPSVEVFERIDSNLRVARGWSNPYAADAAEHYLVGAREILLRRADAVRLAEKAAATRAALDAHMDRAARRDTPWIRTAAQLKKALERDHFDLNLSLQALAELLAALPDAQKRLDPYVEASLLLEDAVRQAAREAALAEAKQAGADLARARSLAPRF